MSPRRAIKLIATGLLVLIVIGVGVTIWQTIAQFGTTSRSKPNAAEQRRINELNADPEEVPIYLELSDPPKSAFFNGQRPCVYFHQGELYFEAVDMEEFFDEIGRNTKLKVNNRHINLWAYNDLMMVYNSRNVLVAGPNYYCFMLNLPRGDHLFAFEKKPLTEPHIAMNGCGISNRCWVLDRY